MTADPLALYFADCIAATAHDFDKKSASKHERKRHLELCAKTADMLEGKLSPPFRNREPDDVVKRLRSMVLMLEKHPAPRT